MDDRGGSSTSEMVVNISQYINVSNQNTVQLKLTPYYTQWASLVALMVKCPPAMEERVCLRCRRPGFNPWAGTIPWRREWQPTPVLLPGESHEQRNLAGYSTQRVRHD